MPEIGHVTAPFSAEFTENPYPTLAELRAAGPVHHLRRPEGLEVWWITRYPDARAALNDCRFSMDAHRIKKALGAFAYGSHDPDGDTPQSLLSTDPPDHDRLRKLVVRAFTPGRVEKLRPRVRQVVDDLLGEIAPRGEADLIESLAAPLPMAIICELLGVPDEDSDRFRLWSSAAFLPRGTTVEGLSATDGMRNLRAYLKELIALKRAETGDVGAEEETDLLSGLIAAHDADDGRLSEPELVSTAVQLLIAGHETTVNGIANAVLALLSHPDQLAMLRAELSLLPQAVEELLRYDGPLTTAVIRIATEDVTVGGVLIPAGALVSIVLGSANRDDSQFASPDILDIRRKENRHLQFGFGIHYCLGAPLARIEAEIAIGSLLTRFPDLSLAIPPGEIRWRSLMIMRAMDALPVRFTPVPST